MSKRNAVAFVKPPEPAFLTAFKKKAGFKEGPSVDTKHEELAFDENQTDREDERPTVVVLKPGDLTEQEAEEAKEDGAQELDSAEEDDKPPADGKIRFKKPKKRSSDDAAQQEQKKKKASSSKKVKNASLLSFNEEDEEDG